MILWRFSISRLRKTSGMPTKNCRLYIEIFFNLQMPSDACNIVQHSRNCTRTMCMFKAQERLAQHIRNGKQIRT